MTLDIAVEIWYRRAGATAQLPETERPHPGDPGGLQSPEAGSGDLSEDQPSYPLGAWW